MPYDIIAQQSRKADEIRQAIDALGDDLGDTIVAAIAAQTTALISAMQQQNSGVSQMPEQDTVQKTIDEINRRTRMFKVSPLIG